MRTPCTPGILSSSALSRSLLACASTLLGLIACQAPTDSKDTADSETTDPAEVLLSAPDQRLHEEIGSMVLVSWEQSAAARVHVEYRFEGSDWRSTPSLDAGAGRGEQVLVGIPFAMPVDWSVVVEGGMRLDGAQITTAATPEGLPQAFVERSEPSLWLPTGNYLLFSVSQDPRGWAAGTFWTVIVDREARPVWARATPEEHWTLSPRVTRAGDALFWDEATYWSDLDDGAASTVHRGWLDREDLDVGTPGLNHAFVETRDGGLAWLSQYHHLNEALVERDPHDGSVQVLWACGDDWMGAGECGSNGLFYSNDDDLFLASFYTNNSIVAVDRTSGSSLWWAGEVSGGYAFEPADSQFTWQHAPCLTTEGTLLLSSRTGTTEPSTSAVEYALDGARRTLTRQWSHDSGELVDTNGSARRLANGNTLMTLGSSGRILEVLPDGTEAWSMDFRANHLLGRSEFIEDLYALVAPAP